MSMKTDPFGRSAGKEDPHAPLSASKHNRHAGFICGEGPGNIRQGGGLAWQTRSAVLWRLGLAGQISCFAAAWPGRPDQPFCGGLAWQTRSAVLRRLEPPQAFVSRACERGPGTAASYRGRPASGSQPSLPPSTVETVICSASALVSCLDQLTRWLGCAPGPLLLYSA